MHSLWEHGALSGLPAPSCGYWSPSPCSCTEPAMLVWPISRSQFSTVHPVSLRILNCKVDSRGDRLEPHLALCPLAQALSQKSLNSLLTACWAMSPDFPFRVFSRAQLCHLACPPLPLGQWFSARDEPANRGHLAMAGDISVVTTWGMEVSYWHLVGRVQGCC